MKKKLLALLLAILTALTALSFIGCGEPVNPDGGEGEGGEITTPDDDNEPDETPDKLAQELKASLKAYLATDEFQNAVLNANTTQARLPMLYLRYVDADFYGTDSVVQFKKYLNYINDLIDGGKIADYKYSSSQITGWYGVTDYLYTWSLVYNQYLQWCAETNTVDESFNIYIPMIRDYLLRADAFAGKGDDKYEYEGETITQANLYYKGYNVLNNFTATNLEKFPESWFSGFLAGPVAEATGLTKAHDTFLTAYRKSASMDASELRTYGKNTLLPLWKDLFIIQQVAFGYGFVNTLPLIRANLGISDPLPYCDEFMLSYYEKDSDGNFIKEGGTPNWVGFSGRPVAASLYRDSERYSVVYEKTMQGYFPFTDGWNQPLDEMVNLDRLCNYYNHDLQTGANVGPQFALLTGMMHGIDMEHYKKEVPSAEFDETGEEIFNVITLWRENLKKDEEGNYIISGTTDMAVAIAYIAKTEGIEAPSPLGRYDPAQAVIKLEA